MKTVLKMGIAISAVAGVIVAYLLMTANTLMFVPSTKHEYYTPQDQFYYPFSYTFVNVPISLKLNISEFSEPKGVGGEANLTVRVMSFKDLSNVTARVNLPQGISFVSGDLTWNGSLLADVSVSFNARIRAVEVGYWSIIAYAEGYYETFGGRVGCIDGVSIHVSEHGINVWREKSYPPPWTSNPPWIANTTITIYPANMSIVDLPLHFQPYEIIEHGFPFTWLTAKRNMLMEYSEWKYEIHWLGLIADIAIYAWIALIVSSVMLYLVRRGLKIQRKKLAMLILVTFIGGIALSLASAIHGIRETGVLDVEIIYFGFPFFWLAASRSVFWASLLGKPIEWTYYINWLGFIGNCVIYSWIIFVASSLALYFRRMILIKSGH